MIHSHRNVLKLFLVIFSGIIVIATGSFISKITIVDVTSYPLNNSIFISNLLILIIVITQILLISQLSKAHYIGKYEFKAEELEKEQEQGIKKIGYFLVQTQHHQTCACFIDHEFTFRDMRICSGCYGTIFGLVINLPLFLLLVLLKDQFTTLWIYFFLLGFAFIHIHFLKYFFTTKSAQRFLLNGLLPIGLNFLIISSITNHVGNLTLIIILFIILVIILLRFLFSSLDHSTITCDHQASIQR